MILNTKIAKMILVMCSTMFFLCTGSGVSLAQLADGVYTLQALHSDEYLQVQESAKTGTKKIAASFAASSAESTNLSASYVETGPNVQTYPDLNGLAKMPHAQWHIKTIGPEKYTLQALHSSEYLHVQNAAKADTVKVVAPVVKTYPDLNGLAKMPHAQWQIKSIGPNKYTLQALHSNEYLQVHNEGKSDTKQSVGPDVRTYAGIGKMPHAHWKINLVKDPKSPPADGQSADRKMPIDNGPQEGQSVQQDMPTNDDLLKAKSASELFAALPEWGRIYPRKPDKNEDVNAPEKDTEKENAITYNVTRTRRSITKTPKEIIVFQPVDAFWLGGIVQGKTIAGGIGSLKEVHIPSRLRKPFYISSTLNTDVDLHTVEKPSSSTVHQTVAKIIKSGTIGERKHGDEEGFDNGTSFYFRHVENQSREQTALELGLDANYMGASVSAALDSKKSASRHSISCLFVEKAFTLKVDFEGEIGAESILIQPSLDASEAIIERYEKAEINLLHQRVKSGEIAVDNLPVFVKSVTYGRMLIFTITSSESEADMVASLNASFEAASGDGAKFNAKVKDFFKSKDTQVEVTSFGGPMSAVTPELIKEGKIDEFFNKDAPLSSMRPISYTLNSVKEDTLASMAKTTDYVVTTYGNAQALGAQYEIEYKFRIDEEDGSGDVTQELYGFVTLDEVPVWNENNDTVWRTDENKYCKNKHEEFFPPVQRPYACDYYFEKPKPIMINARLMDQDKGGNDILGQWSFPFDPHENESGWKEFPGAEATLMLLVKKKKDL